MALKKRGQSSFRSIHITDSDEDNKSAKGQRERKFFGKIGLNFIKVFFLVGLLFYLFSSTLKSSDITLHSTSTDRQDPLSPPQAHLVDPCNKTYVSKSVHHLWSKIDEIVAGFPDDPVSGGIFLYPFQSSLLTYILQQIQTPRRKRKLQVCETGFGSGHSAALFLSASDDVQLVTFDRFDRPYQLQVVQFLEEEFPGRIRHIKGDSCKTLPNFLKGGVDGQLKTSCDFLHGSSMCGKDNLDLIQNSPCGSVLTSTAMTSLNDRAVYFGPSAQWRKLRDDGCIANITCVREGEHMIERNFIFAKKGETFSGEFCIAINSGKCGYDEGVSDDCSSLVVPEFGELCSRYTVEDTP